MSVPFNSLQESTIQSSKTYSVSLACKEAGVSSRQLYYWETLGIVLPTYEQFGSYAYRRYSQAHLNRVVQIKRFIDEGFTLRAAARKVMGKAVNGHREVQHKSLSESPKLANGGHAS